MYYVGGAVAAFGQGFVTEKYGRKWAIAIVRRLTPAPDLLANFYEGRNHHADLRSSSGELSRRCNVVGHDAGETSREAESVALNVHMFADFLAAVSSSDSSAVLGEYHIRKSSSVARRGC